MGIDKTRKPKYELGFEMFILYTQVKRLVFPE